MDKKEKVIAIISEHFNVEPQTLSENTDLVNELRSDSLDLVELIMAFEDEFGLEIPDEVAMSVKKISDVIEYLEKNA